MPTAPAVVILGTFALFKRGHCMHFKIGRWTVSIQQSEHHYCRVGETCEVMVQDDETKEPWQGAGFQLDGVRGWVTPEALAAILAEVQEDTL